MTVIKSGFLHFQAVLAPYIGTSCFIQLHADLIALLTGDLLASTAIMPRTMLGRKRVRSSELTDSSSEKRYHKDIELRELSKVEEQQPPAEEQEDPADDPAEEQQLQAEEQQLPEEEPRAEGPQPEHDNQQRDQEDSPHEISNRDDQEDQWSLVDAATEEGQQSTPQGGPPAPGRAGDKFKVAVNRSKSGSNKIDTFDILGGYNMQFDMYYSSQKGISVYIYILPGNKLVLPLKACLRMNLVDAKGQSASEVIELDYSWDKVREHQKEKPHIIKEEILSQYIKKDGIHFLHFRMTMTIK